MGYECTATGALRVPNAVLPQACQVLEPRNAAQGSENSARELLRGLHEALALDVRDSRAHTDHLEVEVAYYGKWHSAVLDTFAALGRAGVAGSLSYRGEDDAGWMVVLDESGARELDEESYYPGDPDPNSACVALTRREARALLSLVAGDTTDGLDDAVAKLASAVG